MPAAWRTRSLGFSSPGAWEGVSGHRTPGPWGCYLEGGESNLISPPGTLRAAGAQPEGKCRSGLSQVVKEAQPRVLQGARSSHYRHSPTRKHWATRGVPGGECAPKISTQSAPAGGVPAPHREVRSQAPAAPSARELESLGRGRDPTGRAPAPLQGVQRAVRDPKNPLFCLNSVICDREYCGLGRLGCSSGHRAFTGARSPKLRGSVAPAAGVPRPSQTPTLPSPSPALRT